MPPSAPQTLVYVTKHVASVQQYIYINGTAVFETTKYNTVPAKISKVTDTRKIIIIIMKKTAQKLMGCTYFRCTNDYLNDTVGK